MLDQTRKAVGCDLTYAWFPKGERVCLPYWETFEAVKLLGAMTTNGETFFASVEDSFNSDVTIAYLRALQEEFGEYLHLVMDNATYFTSNAVHEFIADSKMTVTHLPVGSPDMNPVEECWRQLKATLGNQLFDSVDDLLPAIWTALEHVSLPEIDDYLCP